MAAVVSASKAAAAAGGAAGGSNAGRPSSLDPTPGAHDATKKAAPVAANDTGEKPKVAAKKKAATKKKAAKAKAETPPRTGTDG